MLRIPFLLWRLLLTDVWRLLLISAGALVAVTAFAATVRPLASGELGPLTAIKFMGFAVPPMLQFALPFAAGFAATLAYHRFAADNEALAANAGGISHRSVLVPAALTGLLLAGVLVRLTNYEIPHYFKSMESLISQDAAGMMIAAIERGEAVEINDMLVHADGVHRMSRDPKGGAERLVLDGVVAASLTKQDDVEVDVTAEHAEVWLLSGQKDGEESTTVVMRLHGAVGWRNGEGLLGVKSTELRPIAFPHATSLHPKFLTSPELEQLRTEPERMPQVDRRRRKLAGVESEALAIKEVQAALRTEGRLTLLGEEDQRLVLRAGDAERDGARWRLVASSPGAPIEADWRLTGGSLRRQLASRAWLRIDADETTGATTVGLDLEDVQTPEAEDARLNKLKKDLLRLGNDPAPAVFAMDVNELMRSADHLVAEGAAPAETDAIGSARSDLKSRIVNLRREILGNRHERFALAVACLVMTLTGAVMALRLRDGLPLTVYLWSFFPALGSVMTIAGGENIVRANQYLGLAVLWSGVAGLSVYTYIVYLDLRRH